MKIRVISDIHLEFGKFDLPIMEKEEDQVLCISGDLNPVKRLFESDSDSGRSTERFFKSLENRFKEVLYVPGNHEYYYGDINESDEKFKNLCDLYGFHFLQEDRIQIEDVFFIGSTLWANFLNENPSVMAYAKYLMNDFKTIRDLSSSDFTFNPKNALLKHKKHLDFILRSLKEIKKNQGSKVVIMTHHAPHYNSIHESYRESQLNGAYYTDLGGLIKEYSPDLWIHGHVHHNCNYQIGKTMVVCNPRGYHNYEENFSFNPEFLVEV